MIRLRSESPEDTFAIGRALGARCESGDVIALDGELGAGKTQFVRGLAEGMGLDPRQVSSPTFVFVHEYTRSDAADANGPVLAHLDAYRLDGPEQLASIGWGDELLAGAVVAVEWAERIDAALGPDRLHVRIDHGMSGTDPGPTVSGRTLTLNPRGRWEARLTTIKWACSFQVESA